MPLSLNIASIPFISLSLLLYSSSFFFFSFSSLFLLFFFFLSSFSFSSSFFFFSLSSFLFSSSFFLFSFPFSSHRFTYFSFLSNCFINCNSTQKPNPSNPIPAATPIPIAVDETDIFNIVQFISK